MYRLANTLGPSAPLGGLGGSFPRDFRWSEVNSETPEQYSYSKVNWYRVERHCPPYLEVGGNLPLAPFSYPLINIIIE